MPQVPRLGINQVQSAQGPQQRVDTSVNQEAFGLGAARNIAPEIAQFAQKIKNDADQVAAMEAENKLIAYQNKFLYDPKDGMINKKGKDAFNLQNDLDESFSKTNAEIANSLSNPVQKAMFEKAAVSRRADMEVQTNKYMSAQIQQYDDETTQANITAEMNNAMNVYQDPDLLAKSMIRQQDAIVAFGNRHGLSPEVVKGKIDETFSKTHSSVISRMLTNGDDIAAENYYNANKDGILGTQKEAVEKELEVGSTRGKAMRFTDDVVSKGMSESQAYAEAAKIENPKVREATEQRISKVFNMKNEAEQERQKSLVQSAADYFDKRGNLDDPKFVKIVAAMTPENRKALNSYIDSNPIRDDGVLYYKLRQMAEDPSTRDAFSKHDLTKELPNLSRDNWNKLITLQEGVKKKDGKADKQLDGALSDSQVIQDSFVAAGFDPKNKQEYANYRQMIDEEIQHATEAKGKKLTNQEIRSIAEKHTLQKIQSSSFFGLFNSEQADFQVSIDQLSDKEIADAKKLLTKKGMTPNDKNVLKVYIANKKQKGQVK